jgi:hypothetical protein
VIAGGGSPRGRLGEEPVEGITLTGEIVQVLIGRHPLLKTLKEKQDSPDGAYLLSSPVAAVRATLGGWRGIATRA